MTKKCYDAEIVFYSPLIKTYEDFELVLKDYRRNTLLVSISADSGYHNFTKIAVSLVIYSKSFEKAQKTLDLITDDIKYYSAVEGCIFEKKLSVPFYSKFWRDPLDGKINYYVK